MRISIVAFLAGLVAIGGANSNDLRHEPPIFGTLFSVDALIHDENDPRMVQVVATGRELRPQRIVVDLPAELVEGWIEPGPDQAGTTFRLSVMVIPD